MKKQPLQFVLKPEQTDFTHARWAPVVNCVVKFRGKILLVQRSKELNFYPGYWNGISGFLDDRKSLKEKVEEELREELGIPKNKIKKITLGEIFDQDEPKYKKTWIVHPVLVEVTTGEVKLDWEARSFQWVTFQEARQKKLLPGFGEVLKRVGKL
ncbi:NUDIX domain-containing protein [bacterium]|nr:NUDIX domain-containing protein [bacterium]